MLANGFGGDLTISKKILGEIGVSEETGQRFLHVCYKSGGHCDCEIKMNAASYLLNFHKQNNCQ